MSAVVLDTCTLLWPAAAPEPLSGRARAILADPQAVLLASSISAWEVAIKARKGKLVLPSTPEVWWATLTPRYGIREIAVSAEIALAAVAEPLPHNDPMDRIIVATARNQASLLTADRVLLDAVDFAVW